MLLFIRSTYHVTLLFMNSFFFKPNINLLISWLKTEQWLNDSRTKTRGHDLKMKNMNHIEEVTKKKAQIESSYSQSLEISSWPILILEIVLNCNQILVLVCRLEIDFSTISNQMWRTWIDVRWFDFLQLRTNGCRGIEKKFILILVFDFGWSMLDSEIGIPDIE